MSIRPRLKILIPATQVLLLIAGAVWHNLMWQRFAGHEMATRYAVTPLDLLAKLNFPLLLAWLPFLYPLKFGLASSRLNLPAGASAFLTGLLDLAILLSVALFWHIAVAEVQARRHGGSLIRSSRPMLEVLKATVLAVTGVGAVAYACWDGHRLLLLGRSNPSAFYWSSVVDAIIGEPLLVIWAVVLIKTSVEDLMFAFRKSENTISEGRWHI